ncbi:MULTISPECIES: hypothetical protein [unclassified Streptomyces]|uniref:hypothetical protein n=1 Tax=unclassified Streptomyces TaxID=2593676 RepID=UPI002E35FFF6|nr:MULTISPECIES: hypothetical protein [unclassified Streptomyces]WUC65103.1 hypothetical protein OG861_13095 [Streptomyces sp. NBC_00539]
MDERNDVRLHVASVESASATEAVCAVRNIGGEASVGMIFRSSVSPAIEIRITEILRYGRSVPILDQAYTARVTFIGPGAAGIEAGETLVSARD